MDSGQARRLFLEHANAVAFVDVELPSGERQIGSAFHIGEGVFVTARHIVEHNRIVEVRITEPVGIRASELFPDLPPETIRGWDGAIAELVGQVPLYKHWTEPLVIDRGPLFDADPTIDVAIFRVRNVHPAVGIVRLGVHWDDWIYRSTWHLSDALVLGYPPIPLTRKAHLVAARAEVHTFVELPGGGIHFILSATPRGGFSGGPAIHEDGYALGVVTSGLVRDQQQPELGFLAVLSIEPIRRLLEVTGLEPKEQKHFYDKVLGLDKPAVRRARRWRALQLFRRRIYANWQGLWHR